MPSSGILRRVALVRTDFVFLLSVHRMIVRLTLFVVH
jgi:hypothetical protein